MVYCTPIFQLDTLRLEAQREVWSLIQDPSAGFPRRSFVQHRSWVLCRPQRPHQGYRHRMRSQEPGGHCLGHPTQSNALRPVLKPSRTQACRMSPYLLIAVGGMPVGLTLLCRTPSFYIWPKEEVLFKSRVPLAWPQEVRMPGKPAGLFHVSMALRVCLHPGPGLLRSLDRDRPAGPAPPPLEPSQRPPCFQCGVEKSHPSS